MQRHYFPSQITFSQGLTSDQRLHLQAVIVGSLRTVIQSRTNSAFPADIPSFTARTAGPSPRVATGQTDHSQAG